MIIDPPLVSVILTSFNLGKFLREAIESVLSQTFKNFELIIWDDGSVDDSWEIIDGYVDSRIRVFRNLHNEGPASGVNKAIFELSRGQYIAIHHSDDVWELNKLQEQVCFLAANQTIGAVFSNAQSINERGEFLIDESNFYYDIFSQPNRSRYEWLRFFFISGNSLCHPSVLIRKSCYFEMWSLSGYFGTGYRLRYVDAAVFKFDIHVLPEKLVRFRVLDYEANSSGNRPEVHSRGYFEYYKLLQNYLDIDSFEDLCLVFPEARKFYRGDNSDLKFALAMIALEISHFTLRSFLLLIFYLNWSQTLKMPNC